MAQLKTVVVVSARTGTPRKIPVERQINSGAGASFYLEKRDAKTRKRLFYSPEEWAALNAAQKVDAADFSDEAIVAPSPERLATAFFNADPLERKALIDHLLPQLREALTPAKVEPAKVDDTRRGGR